MTSAEYPGKDLEAMSFAPNYHRWIVGELKSWLTGEVAEVGAGVGHLSELLLELPIARLHAFEPSRNLYGQLERTLAGESRARTVNGFFGSESETERYDALVYVNVLEHIEKDGAELVAARAALRPGGHLLIFVPALMALYSDFDRDIGHFRRYTRPGLERLVASAGLSIVKSRYFDIAGILPWYVNFVVLRNTMKGGAVSLYDRCVVPVMRRVEARLTPPIGKNVLLVARRN